MTSDAANDTPVGRLSEKTIVCGSGVVIPEIARTPRVWRDGAPLMPVKYPGYWPPTLTEKNRSTAYLTSAEVTSRLTGGAYRIPGLIATVTVFWSGETCGGAAARS